MLALCKRIHWWPVYSRHRWIPRTKGHWFRKRLHVITSAWDAHGNYTALANTHTHVKTRWYALGGRWFVQQQCNNTILIVFFFSMVLLVIIPPMFMMQVRVINRFYACCDTVEHAADGTYMVRTRVCEYAVPGWWLTLHQFTSIALNTPRPRQYGRHFTDDIFKCIFLNENLWI